MGNGVSIDPIEFASGVACKANIPDVLPSESGYCRLSLRFLFSHYYSYPLFQRISTRSRNGYVRRWIRLSTEYIERHGYKAFIVELKGFGDEFLRSLTRSEAGYTYVPTLYTRWAPFIQATHSFEHFCQEDMEMFIHMVDWTTTACYLLSKVPLDRPDLVQAEKAAWAQRQPEVKSDFSLDLLDALKYTTSWLFNEEINLEESEVKHGPGSTSLGHKTVREKELNIRHCIQSLEIAGKRIYAKSNRVKHRIERRPRDAKHIPVKKDSGALRSITAEAINMQEVQQKVKRLMYRYTDEGVINLSRFVKFADQTRSRTLAKRGSQGPVNDLTPATLDQSAASDWLSSELVVNAFSGNNLHYLMCARTWSVKVQGPWFLSYKPVTVNMYAGMGSATTFPVQTTIFTAVSLMAVCAALYKRIFGHRASYIECVQEFLREDGSLTSDVLVYTKNIRVYGDDIIVPEFSTTELFILLEQFGLRVNHKKSFFGNSAVREACGVFAFAGHDISPVRFRIPVWDGKYADYAVFDSLRNFANLSFFKGWSHLYRCAIYTLKRLEPLLTKKDVRRRAKRGKEQAHSGPTIPFEENRGSEESYVGIVSARGNAQPNQVVSLNGEAQEVITYYAPKSDVGDDGQDGYHYKQALYMMNFQDVVPEAHGAEVRGIRLVERNLYLRKIGKGGWAWVPGRSD